MQCQVYNAFSTLFSKIIAIEIAIIDIKNKAQPWHVDLMFLS